MKTAGSMSVERAAKPIKESILSKEHNILLDEKGATLFRAAHNLRMLHKTIQSIKGRVYSVISKLRPSIVLMHIYIARNIFLEHFPSTLQII